MLSFFNTLTKMMCATVVIHLNSEDDMTTTRLPHGDCPWCCPFNLKQELRLLLYTPSSADRGVVISLSNPEPALRRAGADPSYPTVVYLHGFVERAPSYSTTLIKNAYLSMGAYNILLVDWSSLAAAPWYVSAVRNSRLVGQTLARFLLRVDSAGLLPLNRVHVIGFSLGAEAAGFAGKAMPPERRIPRITGLDPAFPLYYGGRAFHLSSGDADFVDVIHTDAGILGYPTPIGDVDFYPNGGRTFQPGCLFSDVMTSLLSCSHLRAWRYYAESVRNPYGFPATQCERWTGFLPPCRFTSDNFMGIMASPKTKGKFYLETNPEPPYGKSAPEESNSRVQDIFK